MDEVMMEKLLAGSCFTNIERTVVTDLDLLRLQGCDGKVYVHVLRENLNRLMKELMKKTGGQ